MVLEVREPRGIRRAWGVLGLSAYPSYDDIRTAYCTLAVATHPDRCRDANAKERFQALHAAYEAALEHHARTAQQPPGGRRGPIDWRLFVDLPPSPRQPRTAAAVPHPTTSAAARKRGTKGRSFGASTTSATATTTAKAAGASTTSAAAAAAAAEQEERRQRAIEQRRRRQPSLAQKQQCRLLVAEAAHRRSIAKHERANLRLLMLIFSETRIRDAVMLLERLTREKMIMQRMNVFC
ncbi:chaperone DnaJ protein [Trypanosoma theileri]|uniref:Chaperone DnaJ protein n=1 Tax=Trypanosoma theileri TaxID=67003 RepID=A0A1X0PA94_9TRYP|nr:chaperone DnaJ protein [Trypanosoma theileri]ORC93543.1 chaperone DnaJ protein [Trypanosoma theileri]